MSLRAKTQKTMNLKLGIRFMGGGHLTHPGHLRALSPTLCSNVVFLGPSTFGSVSTRSSLMKHESALAEYQNNNIQ